MSSDEIRLKEHMDVVLREKDRAIEMASDEREKAAHTLRLEMERSVHEGDERLREHIANQIMQIQAALHSSEKLEMTRFESLQGTLASVVREQESIRSAQRDAQMKFERSVEGRFSQVNEFRGSLDDLSKQMATRRELETGLTNATNAIEAARQERQHQIEDLRQTLTELRSRLDVGAPQIPELQKFVAATTGAKESRAGLYASIGAVGALLAIVIVLANVLTTDKTPTTPVIVQTPATTTTP